MEAFYGVGLGGVGWGDCLDGGERPRMYCGKFVFGGVLGPVGGFGRARDKGCETGEEEIGMTR